ncbi:MAG TPA: hypothetical protein VGZ73_02010 [Bryobacteraceae bacterium]|nr:hypothetical protein [Bryobacteraceae bacterium]
MGVVKTLLRFFSYLFHGILALFLMAVSGLTLLSGGQNLHLGMLPWTGSTLTMVVFFGSICGLVTLLLAMRAKLRALLFLWSLGVAVLMVKGYIFSGYHFAPGEARTAGYLMVAAFLALVGAWFQIWRKVDRAGRY